jgi:4-amino-4-deoxy-L-arabinose transferase-like glycosyltransferase
VPHASALPETSNRSVWIALAVAAAGLLIRLPSLVEPLGIDQGLWASAARGMDRGDVLYRDVWDHKPPGIFLIYWAAFNVFGWNAATINALDILASAVTAVLLFDIGRRLDARFAGALTAALYCVLTVPAWLYRYGGILERSVAENFVVVCVAFAAWCVIRLMREDRTWFAAAAGVALGAAVMFKPNAAVYAPALCVWFLLYKHKPGRWFLRTNIPVWPLAAAAAGTLVVPAAMLAWLAAEGAFNDAMVALVDFNRAYVRTDYAGGVSLGQLSLAFAKTVWFRIKSDPLWVVGFTATIAAGLELVRRRRLDPIAALAVCWGAGAAVAVFANGILLYTTYFIQTLAPLALLGGWFLSATRSLLHRAAIVVSLAFMVLMLFVWKNYPAKVYDQLGADFAYSRGQVAPETYLDRFGGYAIQRGYSARANRELETYIESKTQPGDPLYFFGINFSGLYFATDRPYAHRFLRVNVFTPSWFPDSSFTLQAVTAELERRRPVYIVFEQLHSESVMGRTVDALRTQPDVVRLLGGYRLEQQIEDFAIYRRID